MKHVTWLTHYFLLTRLPVRRSIALCLHLPQEASNPEIYQRKIWRRYFMLLLFHRLLRCSPWLLNRRCSEMNTSHYWHSVCACGLCGLLISVKLLCLNAYETLSIQNDAVLALARQQQHVSSCDLSRTEWFSFKGHSLDVITHLLVHHFPFILNSHFRHVKYLLRSVIITVSLVWTLTYSL